MAFNHREFLKTKYSNIYETIKNYPAKGKKFIMRFKYQDKIYTKTVGYSIENNLTPKRAYDIFIEHRKELESGYKINTKINLNTAFDNHLKTLQNTRWTNDRISVYNLYIKKDIGSKKIDDIRKSDIKKILSSMSKNGYAPNTQKKVLAVLNPLFKSLIDDRVLKENPASNITVKTNSTKKQVVNATELYKKIYNAIREVYADNPFYQAFFLFIMNGRRKSEVINMKWENIDFKNNYYIIEDTKNNDIQKFQLPQDLKQQLNLIKDDRKGYVFKSPVTNDKLNDVKRQVIQMRKYLDMDNFNLHYMRNVLVSMLAENKIEAITLSGILGHRDINTINKYLSQNTLKSSQQGITKIDEIIDVEVVE